MGEQMKQHEFSYIPRESRKLQGLSHLLCMRLTEDIILRAKKTFMDYLHIFTLFSPLRL